MNQWANPVDHAEAVRLYHVEGLTLQEAGDELGVTRERVRQVLAEAGRPSIPGGPPAQRRRRAAAQADAEAARLARLGESREEIVRLRRDGLSTQEVAARFGVTRLTMLSFLYDVLTEEEREDIRRANVGRFLLRATDEDMLDALRAAAAELAGDGWPMNHADFDERWYRAGRSPVSHQTIQRRFGSWNAALAAAGLPHGKIERRKRSDRISDEACASAVRILWGELGHPPTASAYDEWSRGSQYPSVATVRNRFGTWRATIAAAGGPLYLGG